MAGRFAAVMKELWRRRVGRVAVAYAVTAWLVIQVADIVFPRLALPDWLITLLIILAIAGFPVALTLSWFFEIVPEGEPGKRPSPTWVAASVVVLVVLVAGAATVRVWPRVMEGPAEIRSLAVLPFANLSDDTDQAYLAVGIQDGLITRLAQIGAVRVISRTSTVRYGDSRMPLAEIARELGVDALIEGSVLKVGDRLRVQAQLIRPLPRERHLWADGYDRDVRDAMELNAEIAAGVAAAIGAPLTPAEAGRISRARPVNPDAYEAYLRGMYFLRQQTPEGYDRGLRYLNDAIAIDPADPAVYAGLALGYSLVGHGTIPDAFERAKAAARRAIDLDSTSAAAHEALAEIALYHDWDWPTAERELRTALALNPNLPEAAAHYAWYLDLRGRTGEALQSMDRARQLDPLNPLWAAWSGWIALTHDNEKALGDARSAMELNPRHPHALYVAARAAAEMGRAEEALRLADSLGANPEYHWGRAHVLALLGDRTEATRQADEIASRPTPMNAFGIALVHAELGDAEEAMDWLEEAHRLRFSFMPWIHRPAVFTPLDGDPRFEALRDALDLPAPDGVAAMIGGPLP